MFAIYLIVIIFIHQHCD